MNDVVIQHSHHMSNFNNSNGLTQMSVSLNVKPSKLHVLNEYVMTKLKTLEEKIFSNDVGYITNVEKIIDISFEKIAYETHDGAIVFKVVFEAECILPKPGDILTCVLQTGDNVIFGINGPILIFVPTQSVAQYKHYAKFVKEKLVCRVEVKETEIDKSKNSIKVLCIPIDIDDGYLQPKSRSQTKNIESFK